MLFPNHCVANSESANVSKVLNLPNSQNLVYTYFGMDPYETSMSLMDAKTSLHTHSFNNDDNNPSCKTNQIFNGTLKQHLESKNTKILFICGIPFEHQVGQTAIHAKRLGYDVYIITDCSIGISKDQSFKMRLHLEREGISMITSKYLLKELYHCNQGWLSHQSQSVFSRKYNGIHES